MTLFAALLMTVGINLPLIGLDVTTLRSAEPEVGVLRQFAFLPLGVIPFILGFVVVHCVALVIPSLRRSVGSPEEQRPLFIASLGLGVLFVFTQTSSVVRLVESFANANAVIPSTSSLWAQFVVAHLALLGLVFIVSRFGLMNGFALEAVVEAVNHAPTVLKSGKTMRDRGTTTPIAVVLPLVLLVAFAVFLARSARDSQPTFTGAPSRVPFPMAGFIPLSVASALMSLPASLSTWNDGALWLARTLQRSPRLELAADVTLVIVASLFLRVALLPPTSGR